MKLPSHLLSRRPRLDVGLVVAVALIASTPLVAQAADSPTLECSNGTNFPCQLTVEDIGIQKVPSVFKFQARVSQAKLPIGEGTFSTVVVRLIEADTVVCKESFENVEVRESVLNLEIGRNMSCELDEKIAQGSALAFQVCLGSEDSCLKPIDLSTVPYAVKASFAQIAQKAHDADEAALAHYAFRAAADRDLNLRGATATGYFDFHTPGDSTQGYFAWAPVGADSVDLNITGRVIASDSIKALDNLFLDAVTTTANAALTVRGTTRLEQDVTVAANLDVTAALEVLEATTLLGTLGVTGAATLSDNLIVTNKLTVDSTGTVVKGLATLQAGLAVTGDTKTTGALQVGAQMNGAGVQLRRANAAIDDTPYGALIVGTSSAIGETTTAAGKTLIIAQRSPSGATEIPAVAIEAPLWINDAVEVVGKATFGDAEYGGRVTFGAGSHVDFSDSIVVGLPDALEAASSAGTGDWSFRDSFVEHAGQSVLQGTTGSNNLQMLGGLTVSGTLNGNGGLDVLGSAVFQDAAEFRGNATLLGDLVVRFASGAQSEFISPEAGAVVIDANRGLTGMTIQVNTTFHEQNTTTVAGPLNATGTSTFTGTLAAKGKVRFGDVWTMTESLGLQRQVGATPTFGTALNVAGGTTVVLDQGGHFPNGTQAGGRLESLGQLVSAAGLQVKSTNVLRLAVDDTHTQILTTQTTIAGDLAVAPQGSGGGSLQVNASGMTVAGTSHSISGAVSVNGPLSLSKGLAGSGQIKAIGGSCKTEQGMCTEGRWSLGVASSVANCTGSGACLVTTFVQCCKLELTN